MSPLALDDFSPPLPLLALLFLGLLLAHLIAFALPTSASPRIKSKRPPRPLKPRTPDDCPAVSSRLSRLRVSSWVRSNRGPASKTNVVAAKPYPTHEDHGLARCIVIAITPSWVEWHCSDPFRRTRQSHYPPGTCNVGSSQLVHRANYLSTPRWLCLVACLLPLR